MKQYALACLCCRLTFCRVYILPAAKLMKECTSENRRCCQYSSGGCKYGWHRPRFDLFIISSLPLSARLLSTTKKEKKKEETGDVIGHNLGVATSNAATQQIRESSRRRQKNPAKVFISNWAIADVCQAKRRLAVPVHPVIICIHLINHDANRITDYMSAQRCMNWPRQPLQWLLELLLLLPLSQHTAQHNKFRMLPAAQQQLLRSTFPWPNSHSSDGQGKVVYICIHPLQVDLYMRREGGRGGERNICVTTIDTHGPPACMSPIICDTQSLCIITNIIIILKST